MAESTFPSLVQLNVGGVFYATSLSTLTSCPSSLLGQLFAGKVHPPAKTSGGDGGSEAITLGLQCDDSGRYFLDRDGVLFRYVLDFMRNKRLVLPENFLERERLRHEAEYYQLTDMVKQLQVVGGGSSESNTASARSQFKLSPSMSQTDTPLPLSSSALPDGMPLQEPSSPVPPLFLPDDGDAGYITLGYRGTFAFGSSGMSEVKFRKLARVLICGRVSLCRRVFRDTLNESRDPDRGSTDRYSSRFFLKHTCLEQAFEMLQEAGFRLVASCASGTSSASDLKPGMDSEENKWNHYNEFIFCRP